MVCATATVHRLQHKKLRHEYLRDLIKYFLFISGTGILRDFNTRLSRIEEDLTIRNALLSDNGKLPVDLALGKLVFLNTAADLNALNCQLLEESGFKEKLVSKRL